MDTLGLYVQVPFCASKCSFCNFSSRVEPSTVFDFYVETLEKEITGLRAGFAGKSIPFEVTQFPVDTVYIGGGTPSVLGITRLSRIVCALRDCFRLEVSPEFTLEVTPGSADGLLLSALRETGVNRLSIGAQSLDDRELSSVGRLHSASDTRQLVAAARRSGCDNINLDLIAGLPYQTEASWRDSVRSAVALEPEHLSVYLFEVDEKSRLGGEVLRRGSHYHAEAVPGDDFMADAYESAREWLSHAGYVQYEISNFALPGRESKHNQKYWQLQPYVGLGAGAHSYDGKRRWANEIDVKMYQDKIAGGDSPIESVQHLPPRDQLAEFFFLGLRQRGGVDLGAAERHWGEKLVQEWKPKLDDLAQRQWIRRDSGRVALHESSYLVSNEIFQEFLSPHLERYEAAAKASLIL